jgi:hypothetical protein
VLRDAVLKAAGTEAARISDTASFVDTVVDRITPLETIGLRSEEGLRLFAPDASPEDWCVAMEQALRAMIARQGGNAPDPVTARFEAAALADPAILVADFVEQSGIEQRRLERIVRRDFGITPKHVLRRARARDCRGRDARQARVGRGNLRRGGSCAACLAGAAPQLRSALAACWRTWQLPN